MARLGRRVANLLLFLEEIVLQVVFLLNFVNMRRPRIENSQTRLNRMIRYRMDDNTPDRIKYMSKLVGVSDTTCFAKLRMNRDTFNRLCYLLEHGGGLCDSKYVPVREKVALFLTVLAHHTKFRVASFDFKRSGQTGCLGALDGSYFPVTVSEADKARYRTRKGAVAVNVLLVCNPDMQFIYMLTGWEESAADSRVLRDAVSRTNGFKVPQGNYYLCDNGYTNGEGFLTPYKSVRYHLDDWGVGLSLPQNAQEFYNMNHSRARNVIERSFGLMKKRWACLRSATFYPIKIQNRIIMACGLLHNFIRKFQPNDPLLEELDDLPVDHDDDEDGDFIDSVESSTAWTTFRDNLSQSMFAEWQAYGH